MALVVGLISPAQAQVGTAITYQGVLERNGQKINSATDMRFRLFDDATSGTQVGSTVTLNATSVENGLFNVPLDFGLNPYATDRALWMQIDITYPAGSGAFLPMAQRQRMTPAPFSLATRGITVGTDGSVGVGQALVPTGLTTEVGGTSPILNLDVNFRGERRNGLFSGAALRIDDRFDWPRFQFITRAANSDIENIRMVVTEDGKVGINTLAPTATLNVVGSVAASSLSIPGDAAFGGIVSVGSPVGTHAMSVQSGVAGNALRLFTTSTNFGAGARLNFGDANFVYLQEDFDDHLLISATNGTLCLGLFTAPAKNFRIDHPSDPQNKILNHGCVESNEYVGLYRGNAVVSPTGNAWVQLPAWMQDLNMDFSYQLTAVGAPQPNLYIATELNRNNQFQIAGGVPGAKVSWIVTGTRHDAFVRAHPLVIEEDKPAEQRGTYLTPDAFGVFTPEELTKRGAR